MKMIDVYRGEIWWADLPDPAGSEPGYTHQVLILQVDEINESAIATTIGAVITSNLRLAKAPGNILIHSNESGLKEDSVINISQITTIDKNFLRDYVGTISEKKMIQVENGLRLILGL
jgi:mRNA interferase MazF